MRAAAAVTWLLAALPVIATRALDPLWCIAYLTFGIAFAIAVTTRSRRSALVVQSIAAIVAIARGGGAANFGGVLLVIVAGEAPLLVGERLAIAWVIAQTAALAAVAHGAYFAVAAYTGFQVFALAASRLTAREIAARTELARVHAELLATQELFADSTRTAERLRISRELHDALGHNLTALSLQLEVARNVADGRAKEPVERAHAVTKTLLAELRSVVDAMREEAAIDLPRALRTLAGGIPRPVVHLDVRDDLRLDAARSHAIFRCVQEALTNAIRHAGAANIYVAVDASAVTVRDDGRGATSIAAGHGLTGLRERVEGMGGTLEIVARLGEGVTLTVRLP